MKYIYKAIFETKAKWFIALEVIFTVIYMWINAKILLWISYSVSEENHKYLIMVAIGCLINTILGGIVEFSSVSTHHIFTYLNNTYADKVLSSDVKMYSQYSPGTIANTGSQIFKFAKLAAILMRMIRNIVSVIVDVIAIITIAPSQIFQIMVVFSIMAIIMIKVNHKWEDIDKKTHAIIHNRDIELDEITNGFMEMRSFAETSQAHHDKIHQYNGEILGMIKYRKFYDMLLGQTINVGDSITSLLVLVYVLLSFESDAPIVPATGLALVMYVWRLSGPFASFVFGFSEFSELKAALPKFVEIMEYENSIEDGKLELDSFGNGIAIENVVFGYDKSSTVLDNITMSIPKGSHVGICGPSGGGKSTILKLLPRFYDVNSGSIKIDGINIKDLKLSSLRKYIGIVHQQTYIFDGTLRDNIAYGMRPHKVDDYKIIEACKQASLYDFIMTLPDGLDTNVGPRGLKLSGGQKQRISLARLFLVSPEIILLDEATSALDNETEAAVQDALKIFSDKTVITIAHRLSTIKYCDKIYVINNHKIAESGSHEELLAIRGIYYNMQK